MNFQNFNAFALNQDQQNSVIGGAKLVSAPPAILPVESGTVVLPAVTLPVIDTTTLGTPIVTDPIITRPTR